MNDILVLGMIPGTSIQVTFNEWLITLAVLFAVYSIYKAYRYKRPANPKLPLGKLFAARFGVNSLVVKSISRRLEISALSAYARIMVPLSQLASHDNDDLQAVDITSKTHAA